jgi:hypothetical protein
LVGSRVVITFRPSSVVRPSTFHILIFSSETTGPIATTLWWNGPWMAPFQNCVRWWFSPGSPASSTTKTGRHDIAEILLKVALNTKNQIKSIHVDYDFLIISKYGNVLYKYMKSLTNDVNNLCKLKNIYWKFYHGFLYIYIFNKEHHIRMYLSMVCHSHSCYFCFQGRPIFNIFVFYCKI